MKLEKKAYYKETINNCKLINDNSKQNNDNCKLNNDNCKQNNDNYENKNININDILSNNDETEITLDPKNIKLESKYDYSKKMILVKKINKIKKKDYLINIFKIITKDSKDFSENNNGIFIFFHNLSDETYEKLDVYVNYIYKIYYKNNNSEISDIMNISDIKSTIDNKKEILLQNNLSNKEKTLLKRKKYEEYITYNQNQ
jgi:hypothetical protein